MSRALPALYVEGYDSARRTIAQGIEADLRRLTRRDRTANAQGKRENAQQRHALECLLAWVRTLAPDLDERAEHSTARTMDAALSEPAP